MLPNEARYRLHRRKPDAAPLTRGVDAERGQGDRRRVGFRQIFVPMLSPSEEEEADEGYF
jgi:hypothetical protein